MSTTRTSARCSSRNWRSRWMPMPGCCSRNPRTTVSAARRMTIRQGTRDGMPANIEIICNLGDVLTLTAGEAVQCGLCDGVADSVEEVLQKMNVPVDSPPRTLPDPFKQSNTQMDGVVKTFLSSIAALGGSVQMDGNGHPPPQLQWCGSERYQDAGGVPQDPDFDGPISGPGSQPGDAGPDRCSYHAHTGKSGGPQALIAVRQRVLPTAVSSPAALCL